MILNNKGITLIELLIVCVIVGILAAVAIPAYKGYMVRARRADAKTALEQLRASQEVFRAERGRYATDALDPPNAFTVLQNNWGGPAATIGDYNLSFTVLATTSFTAQAQPIAGGRQAIDGALTIDHNGTKLPADKWAK